MKGKILSGVCRFFLYTWAFLLALLPRKVFLFLGASLGSFLAVIGFRRKIVRENIALAYPQWSEAQREELLRENYRHTGIIFLEFLRFFFRMDRFLERYCSVEGEEHLRAALSKSTGVLVLTAHQGNWEVLVGAGAHLVKVPVTMVTKQLKPDWFHALVEDSRAKLGVKMAFEPRTLRVVMSTMHAGGVAGFVMDQYTGAPVGARVEFFGRPVGTHTALAVLALRLGVPVVPAYTLRDSRGNYVLRFEPEIELERATSKDQEELIIANTARFAAKVEEWVRKQPGQWLWIHRRWKGDLSPLPAGKIGELLK